MICVCPDYFPEFQCIASRCQHSCCIGWEIDVDEDTMKKYRAVDGAFGERLRQGISDVEPHFVLGKEERCPFLNQENLCDIILQLGEGALCQICSDHPRFYTWLPDRMEEGLGLCCEEAARLLLEHKGKVQWIEQEMPGEEDYEADEGYYLLLQRRDNVFSCLQNRTLSISERLAAAFALHGAAMEQRDIEKDIAFLNTLEVLDERWSSLLQHWSVQKPWPAEEIEQILVYLVYRYYLRTTLEEGDALFALRFGNLTMHLLSGLPEQSHIELVRMWSAELEYSEENLELLADYLRR